MTGPTNVRFEETTFSEPERYVLRLLGDYGPGIGLQLPEGKMADCAADLIQRGLCRRSVRILRAD